MSSSSTITEAKRAGTGLGRPAHPGEVLAELYLDELGLSANDLAAAIARPAQHMQDVLDAKRPIDADLALRLAKAFGSRPQLWLNMQNSFDLEMAERDAAQGIAAIKPLFQPDAA